MKVSHEVPIPYLEKSRDFNDYDYCLPHLLDQSKEYRDFFYESKKRGRYIIMDNSLHELGKAYDSKRLRYWVNELEPNEFIVPDVWEDKTQTLVSAKFWSQIILPEDVEKVAVVQAKSYSEARECYRILHNFHYYKKIAFSYGASYYNDLFPHPNPLVGKMMGRVLVISKLYQEGIISDSDQIHLLGCALPQEFSYYQGFNFIKSIDTSNPVIHGLAGITYKDYGLLKKLPHKVDRFEGNSENWEDVLYNVNKFREFIPNNKKIKNYANQE